MKGQNVSSVNRPRLKLPVWILLVVAVIAVAAIAVGLPAAQRAKQPPEIITVSALQEIVDVDELSTYTAVYNGIATVSDEENPDEVKYYVSYKAKVYAGIDFGALDIETDDEEKMIRIKLPEVRISAVDVDIASMDFLFYDDKANTSTVTQEAYKSRASVVRELKISINASAVTPAGELDAQQESEKQTAICDLAKDNACNVLKALIAPLVEQNDAGYSLSIS